ncbi:hypothetical protein SFUMM280S_09915 [Streptomyces fumanus]
MLAAAGTDPVKLAAAVDKAVAGRGAQVLHGNDRGIAEFPDAISGKQNLIPVAGAFGGLATMVAIFVVGSTVGMLMQQRRREMALLRTTGVTPGQLRRMVMAETFVIAVLAAALSLAPGQAFGRFMYRHPGRPGPDPRRDDLQLGFRAAAHRLGRHPASRRWPPRSSPPAGCRRSGRPRRWPRRRCRPAG